MLESDITYGSIETTDEAKRRFAAASIAYNARDKVFAELFPDLVEGVDVDALAAAEAGADDAASDPLSALGHEARLTGLSAAQWNDKSGYVIGYDTEAGRYSVSIGGSTIKVKPENLKVLEDPLVAAVADTGIDGTAAAAGAAPANTNTTTLAAGTGGRNPLDRSTWGKVGANTPCPCESGKKYKKCCMNKE